MNIIPPTHEQTTVLAALVRGGTLTDAQRDQTAVVLGMIGSALRVAAQADNPGSAAGAWSPVEVEFARLVAETEG